MSLIHFEGFDNQTVMPLVSPWAGSINNAISNWVTGRYGDYAAGININNGGGNLYLNYNLAGLADEILVGFAFKGGEFDSANGFYTGIFEMLDGNGAYSLKIYTVPNGTLYVARAGNWPTNGVTLGSTAPGVMTVDTWYYIEVYVKIGDSGAVIVRKNEAEVINLSGVDTKNGTSNTIGGFTLGRGDIDWYGVLYNFDDLYIIKPNDNNGLTWFLGDVRVETLVPTAEGNTINWSPSGGTDNALMVDELIHDGDTTYNSTATVNNKDTLTYGNLATTNGIVHAVRYNTIAKKGTGGGLRKLAPVIRHGGADYIRSSFPLADSYIWNSQTIDEDNPATGVDWTISDINNAEFGYQLTE